MNDTILTHHGIDGQKWGQRNGPPYPLDYQSHSFAEKRKNPKGQIDNYKYGDESKSSSNKKTGGVRSFVSKHKKGLIAGGITVAAVGTALFVGSRYVNSISDKKVRELSIPKPKSVSKPSKTSSLKELTKAASDISQVAKIAKAKSKDRKVNPRVENALNKLQTDISNQLGIDKKETAANNSSNMNSLMGQLDSLPYELLAKNNAKMQEWSSMLKRN